MNKFNPWIDKQKNLAAFFIACLIGLCPIIASISPRSIALIPILITIIGYALYIFETKNKPALNWHILISFLAIIILMATSLLWSEFFDTSLSRMKKTIPLLIIIGLSLNLCHALKSDIRLYLPKLIGAGFIIGAIILCINLYGHSIIYSALNSDKIIHSTNLSHLNRSCVALVLFGIANITINKLNNKIITIPTAILLLLIAHQTHSQSAQLAFIIGMSVFTCCKLLPKITAHKITYSTVTIIICSAILTAPFIAHSAFTHLASAAAEQSWLQHGYAAQRLEIWDFISRKALEKPILGHGLEATRATTDFDIAYIFHETSTILHPHNFILQIWIELGLLGALLLAFLIKIGLRSAWQQTTPESQAIFLPLAASLLVTATISYGLWQGWWLGLIGIALIIMVSSIKYKENIINNNTLTKTENID